jgi:cell pole-organizing protein PopZ
MAKARIGVATGMRQAGEPSVEEILASIKKVIARDNRVEATRRDTVSGSDTALRDRFGDVLDLGEVAAQILAAEPAAPTAAPGRAVPESADDDDAPLLNAATASAMRDSLDALALLSQPGAQPQIVRSGETSLEGMVRDMLRPMLAEWLDKHLPAMVDRMVAAEITRIARKKG